MSNIRENSTVRQAIETSYDASFENLASVGFAKDTSKSDHYDSNIVKMLSPYSFRMNQSFKTYKQMMVELYRLDNIDPTERAAIYKDGTLSPEKLLSKMTDNNPFFVRATVADTSIGGNEVVNSRWAFGRDDDIIDPMHALKGDPNLGGIGRVYHELYQVTTQSLYLTVGVPEFKVLWKFYTECVNGNMANDVNSGESRSIGTLIGTTVGTFAGLVIKLPVYPIIFIDWLADTLSPTDRVTQYYELRGAMPMYYRYVNTLFAQLCILMGLTQGSWMVPDNLEPGAGKGGETGGTNANASMRDLMENSRILHNEGRLKDSLPMFMRDDGPNVYKILSKRDYRYDLSKRDMKSIEHYMNPKNLEEGGYWDIFSNRKQASQVGADKFIKFRLNKSTDSSESFTNSSGQSTIAQTLNAAAAAGKEAQFSMGGNIDNIFKVPVVGDILGGMRDVVKGVSNSFGLSSLASATMTGSGFVDIPEVWMSSSFSKSYSFNFTFRPGAGDNVSIAQDCYLPMTMLMALACPRSVGQTSYTSPFIVRAYCRGMFATPCGLVDSMNITRGSSDFGWNMNRLPTVINISMTIKDLAPIMHMAMADNSTGMKVFGGNTPMQEYMHTLAGSGPNERILFLNNAAQRLTLIGDLLETTFLSPEFLATKIADFSIPRILGAMSPISLY